MHLPLYHLRIRGRFCCSIGLLAPVVPPVSDGDAMNRFSDGDAMNRVFTGSGADSGSGDAMNRVFTGSSSGSGSG